MVKNVLYVALASLAVCLCVCAALITHATIGLIEQSKDSEVRVSAALVDIPAIVESFRDGALTRIDVAAGKADTHLKIVEGIARKELSAANTSLAQVASIAPPTAAAITAEVHAALLPIPALLEHSTATIDAAGAVVADVKLSSPLFFDCRFNADCAFNRYQGTAKAAERSFEAIAIAAPQIALDARAISGDVRREADTLTKPKSRLEKAAHIAVVAGMLAARIIF